MLASDPFRIGKEWDTQLTAKVSNYVFGRTEPELFIYVYMPKSQVCICDMKFPGLVDDKQALAQDVPTGGSFAQDGAKLLHGIADSAIRPGVDRSIFGQLQNLHLTATCFPSVRCSTHGYL